MKKYILFPLMALALTIVSCDMDKEPYDAIPDTEALQTPTDFQNMSVGLYSGLRACIGSQSFYNAVDIQCDGFNAISGFTGSVSDMYTWNFFASSSYAETVYANCQAIIARANFIIDGYNKCDMSNPNLFTDAAKQTVGEIKGEAFFTRAFCIYELAQYFCKDYDENIADEENSGVSYRLDYSPSSSAASVPARSTLRATYKQITDDLDSAAYYIRTAPEGGEYYISPDAIDALYARVALSMDNYEMAYTKAVSVINTQNYTLAGTSSAIERLWWDDFDNESILKLAVTSTSDLAGQTGRIFLPYTDGGSPDYIPTLSMLQLYPRGDNRISAYFLAMPIQTPAGTSGTVYALNKYTDKGFIWEQNQGDEYSRFMIEPKVIRISEMYLIAAEAYAQRNMVTEGAKYLNDHMKKRINGFTDVTYANADDLMEEIRNERTREFIGEGMRLFDLKRWKMGIKRGTPQQENLCYMPGLTTTTNLDRTSTDYRMVWPIPQHEIDASNKKVAQNPGY